MQIREMTAAHPDVEGSPDDALMRCIEQCYACAQACTSCADACLAEEAVAEQRLCIRLNLDCADLCLAAGAIATRRTGSKASATVAALEACETACRLCGDECAKHGGHMEHCRICAEACRRCEQSCREAVRSIAGCGEAPAVSRSTGEDR